MRNAILIWTGWVLTALGLLIVLLVVYLAMNRLVFEAMALSLPSIIVFRAGIGMIRMAAAARIATGIVDNEFVTPR